MWEKYSGSLTMPYYDCPHKIIDTNITIILKVIPATIYNSKPASFAKRVPCFFIGEFYTHAVFIRGQGRIAVAIAIRSL